VRLCASLRQKRKTGKKEISGLLNTGRKAGLREVQKKKTPTENQARTDPPLIRALDGEKGPIIKRPIAGDERKITSKNADLSGARSSQKRLEIGERKLHGGVNPRVIKGGKRAAKVTRGKILEKLNFL